MPEDAPKTKKTFTPEHRAKLRRAKLGKSPWNKGKAFSLLAKKHMSEAHKGVPHPHGGKPNPKNAGSNHYKWRGGVTPINTAIRHSLEYRLWRTSIFTRDKYTCIWCGAHGVVLNADHIKPFASYPELRFAIDNGRTLCVPCHRKTDTFGGKKQKS